MFTGIVVDVVRIMPLAGNSLCLNCYPFDERQNEGEGVATRLNYRVAQVATWRELTHSTHSSSFGWALL